MKKKFITIVLLFALVITSANAVEVTSEEKITGLYVAYFDRAADQEGLTYWTDKAVEVAQGGGDESSVFKTLSEGFATHPTFTETYDHLNNEEFVSLIYQNALGRDGDAEGIAYWTDLLDRSVMLRPEMVATFVELSLVTDLIKENYPNLTVEELAAAQLRQDLITNKVDASLMFTKQLSTFSNVVDSQDPEEDPAYLASIKIISEVTEEVTTVSSVKYFLDYMDDNEELSDQIAFINTNFPNLPGEKDAPVFTSDLIVNINENTLYVTTITATDYSEPIKFELFSYADGLKFKLNEKNQLNFLVAPDFEAFASYDMNNTYKVGVKATDALGNSRSRTIRVIVNNTDAPGFISESNVTVKENTIAVTSISVQGEDPAGTVTLSMTGGEDQSLFDFDPTSGLSSFKTAPDFENPLDADKNNVYKVEVTATEGSTSVKQQMEITVENIGEASLQIVSAIYDDKGTAATTDDSLFVYFDRQIDDGSWSAPEFELTNPASIAETTFEYTKDSPYRLTVTNGLSDFVPNTTNINVAEGGFTVDGETVQTGAPVTVTAMQGIIAPGDRSFTLDETNETIIDDDSGLTWQNIADTQQNWSDAIATCNDLELKGKTDWRLPNIHELVSIANKTKTDPASYQEFNQSIHPRYWSSTSYINDDSRAWIIHLTSSSEGTVSETKSNNNIYARCVRGKSQTERTFIRDFATKIVYDTNSDLLWHDAEKTQESDNLTWQQANTYCADMIVGGYTWRVPSFSELQSIVNYDSFLPSINKEVFLNINSEGHWASTVDANAVSNKAWSIRFSGGEGVLEDKDSPSRTQSAKCVTDAQ